MKRAIALLGAIASLFFAGEGVRSQVTFQGRSQYVNYGVFQNQGVSNIILSGNPGQQFDIFVDGWKFERNIVSNSCGFVILKFSAIPDFSGIYFENSWGFPSGWRTINNIPTQIKPNCVNSVLSEQRTAPFKTAEGELILPLQPNTAYRLQFLASRSIRLTANRCGIAILRNFNDFSAFLGGRNGISLADIPEAPSIPRCLSVDGRSIPFVPLDWQL